MAESLIAGAAVGAVFGELLKAVLDVKDRAVMFKQTLMYLQSTLIAIAPVIKEMDQHNKDLGHPKEELESLIRQMDEGAKLVVKCSKIHRLNLVAKVRYQDQLVGLVDSLTRFFIIDMQAQTARDQKETLIKVRKLLSTVNKLPFINTQDTSGACSDSNPVSGEVAVMESEIYASKKAQRADENAHYIVEDMEEVEIYFSCASSPCAIGVNESDTPRSTQPSENACRTNSPQHGNERSSVDVDFFSEYGEGSRYRIAEVIGKGSQGIVCSAYDTHSGKKVAIKKISDIFEHGSDGTCILREIKLLRLLRHPDIVEIKHILLPPSRREFKDVYVVFELMESDLDVVIKANDDLTPEHHQFFLYQLLRALKYLHTANVFHRDLKPKNILANADCKLKICDFGLARVAFNDTPTAKFWTDYVAARWYRAPELCGSFFSKYTPAIDMWSIGCIFAELVTGKPLFPGNNVVHQLDLMTNFLGTPSPEAIARVRNEKARRYLSSMRKKKPVPFSRKFRNVDPLALRLLERMLAFDPKDRPTAEEALADPYFKGLAKIEREPACLPISEMEFEFERRRITKEDVRELIYREILEYHPKMLKEYLEGANPT